MDPVTFRLFVCATFMSGEREHATLMPKASPARRIGAARTAVGYSLVETRALGGLLGSGEGDVVGELYEVSYEVLRACDKLRDHPSRFERRDVKLEDGTIAHAYFFREDQARGLRRIKGGDWKQRFAVAKPAGGALVQWAKGRHR